MLIRSMALVFLSLLLCTCSSGCIVFYGYHPVHVRALDAETGAPLAAAELEVRYMYFLVLNAPKNVTAKTNQNGEATMQCAAPKGGLFDASFWGGFTVRSKGYLDTTGGRIDANFVELRSYKSPEPHITIALPAGFRGPVKLSFEPIEEWVQGTVGQREFTFVADAQGNVRIPATPLFTQHLSLLNISASEGGKPLPEPFYNQPMLIGFRWVEGGLLREVYVVGTQADHDALWNRFNKPIGGGSTAADPAAFDRFWNEQTPTTRAEGQQRETERSRS